jgi:ribosomal-protein-alanine N-acetyltransferase
MKLSFRPIDEASVLEIIQWRYEPPYDMNNMGSDTDGPEEIAASLRYFMDPQYAFHAVLDAGTDALVAYCSFGPDGQVPGGDYSQAALDIGLGLRPDLTGQGHGTSLVRATIEFARRTYKPALLRVTIAAINKRAQRVWQKNGFVPRQSFAAGHDGRPFIIFTRTIAI